MVQSEFDLIRRYLASRPTQRADVLLGIGDDCALLRVPQDAALAVTLDTLVAGIHFASDADPVGIGHKSLAVNLSDLAAMGAVPAWATLALTLPESDESWLAAFCEGFFALAGQFQVQLVGGDTTHGPLSISVQAHGFVPGHQALRRDGANPGDLIFVTGSPGDAGMALAILQGRLTPPSDSEQATYLQTRLDKPTPRIRQGLELRGLASAAIDISDGLAQDLGHILESSGLGASLQVDQLPYSPALATYADTAIAMALAGGDDYELCFTAPPAQVERILDLAAGWDCACTQIGVIETELGLRHLRADGTVYQPVRLGYDHFA
ncbi:MAG: thiamine-phosphate kinase [Candidatus Competibacteraceae bacterium]|jgi:thiamine-monophosphate kinase|nr:thiamine-phosphate kinase [Candidatus Competibacteraceae bacterium]